MSFQLFSDIHTELNTGKFPKIPKTEDYLILAGDIGKISLINFRDFITYCSNKWVKVFFVFGNHEFYISRSIDHIKIEYKKFFDTFSNVFLLDSDYIIVDNIAIYGFIGWTKPTTDLKFTELNDYKYIHTKKGKLTTKYVKEMVAIEINKFKQFINDVNNNIIKCDIVMVITHFPPIGEGTSNPIYNTIDNHLNSYFKWDDYITSNDINCIKLKIWLSGHTHHCYDFVKSFTEDMSVRFLSNQIGYAFEQTDFTNCIINLDYLF